MKTGDMYNLSIYEWKLFKHILNVLGPLTSNQVYKYSHSKDWEIVTPTAIDMPTENIWDLCVYCKFTLTICPLLIKFSVCVYAHVFL